MISGPHSIGKTTTAKLLAEELGYTNVHSVAAQVAGNYGYDIDKCEPNDIIRHQERILEAFQYVYEATKEAKVVHDRSPLDFYAYTVMQLRNSKGKHNDFIGTYREQCIKTINENCDLLVIPVVDWNEPYEHKDGRPVWTKEQAKYREEYHKIVKSVASMTSESIREIFVPIEHQYKDRVWYIINTIEALTEKKLNLSKLS